MLPLSAQTFYGTILGTVTDSSGAGVPGASITLLSPSTGDRRTAETDSSGSYRFINLIPGVYRLEIEKAGFKRQTRDDVNVNVEAALRIDARVEVGDVTQTVEVTAQTPLLQTDSTALSKVVEGRTVTETPLNGRNVLNLVSLVPGVVPQGSFSGSAVGNQNAGTSTNNFGWGNFQAGGGMANQSATFLDGTPLNGPESNIMALVPTQDVIQEFRIATSNVSPEFGRFAGAVVNMTTKSGGNQFHGGAYEFLRNKLLNANNFINNSTGSSRPPFTQNQYGATLGGPIQRDKTFFFFNWEQYWQRQGSPLLTTVPTEAMKAGDFSAAGLPVIYDARTNPRIPFANNVIPANRIDPTAKVMTQYWSAPNLPGILNNFTTNTGAGGDYVQYNIRLDHNLSDRQRLFGRYTYWDTNPFRRDPFHNITAASIIKPGTDQAAVGDTYSLNPTTVLEFRLGYWRHYYDEFAPNHGNVDLSQFGPAYAKLAPFMTYHIIPGANINGFYNISNLMGFGANNIYTSNYSVTKIVGRHSLKIGGEFRRDEFYFGQLAFPNNASSGGFVFDNTWTQQGPATRVGGYPFASFMLGYATSGSIATLSKASNIMYYQGYYVADTFQVNRKLTLTAGLRWELPGFYTEKKDRDTVLDPTAIDPLAARTGLPLKGQLVLVNSPGRPDRHALDRHWALFAPRLGLAYRLNEKTVVRTGYGIAYTPTNSTSPNNSPINIAMTVMETSRDGNVTPFNVLSNPFPNGILQPPLRDPAALFSLEGGAISGANPASRFPYVQQWNFNIQRELLSGAVLEVGYAGSKGTHLAGGQSGLNQLSVDQLSLGSGLTAQVRNPLAGLLPATSGLNAATVSAGQLLRPYPQYTNVSIATPTNADSIYHSLQVSLQKRFRGGGNFTASYTWSKFLSNSDASTTFLDSTTGTGAVQDNSNLRNSRSLISFDVPHRLTLSYTYDLPVGKGKRFLGNINSAADRVLGGWGFNGVTTIQSGFPLTFTSSATSQISGFGFGTLRPNVVAGCQKTVDGDLKTHLRQAFNTSCFSAPSAFGIGNESRTDPNLRGQGIANWDFSVFKAIPVTERIRMQFRTEFFNIANRVQFGNPGTAIGNPTFGQITSQLNLPRLVQFALRLNF